jgi:hypothetical protein
LQKTLVSKATRKAIAAKKTITTRKRNVKTIDLTADNDVEMQKSAGDNDANKGDKWPHIDDLYSLSFPPLKKASSSKKVRINYFSDSSSNENVVNETFKLNDEIRIASSVDKADIGMDRGNEKVIKSPVRPRRSGKERKAIRKSLNYRAEMRKGR